MSNIPEKIIYHLGYDNMALVLDQERKHWLMKTDKQRTIQDTNTGNMYRGTIDNIGSDVIIETEKLSETYEYFTSLVYSEDATNKVLNVANSAFTYSNQVNGLMFARVISINYPTSDSITEPVHKTFRLKLTNCEECIIPFGVSDSSDAVFADRWICTSDTPLLQLIDGNGQYTIDVQLTMNGCTNGKYYFPLNETLQPVSINHDGSTYITDALTDESYIGYPLYWFTCDETNIGPQLYINNPRSNLGRELCVKGNPGDMTKYDVRIYVGVDGNNDATPDDSPTSAYKIICHSVASDIFDGTDEDFRKPIRLSSIIYKNTTTDVEYNMGLRTGTGENATTYMSPNIHWTFVDSNTYEIGMDAFDANCIDLQTAHELSPVFNIKLDTSIPFVGTDKSDLGYAGIRLSANNTSSDVYPRYPHNLSAWDGIPEWLRTLPEDGVPQHLAVYAIHNTPGYIETIPDSRQVAALLFDPGKKKTSDSEELSNDERGRVYLLSNDDTTYRNNQIEKTKEKGMVKPDRTLARICDIPTSVFQLFDVSGLSETVVVDPDYVRSQASYTTEDKNRLWNEVNWYDRWVRPTALDRNGQPISSSTYPDQNGDKYVFQNANLLKSVEMKTMNNFCRMVNINPTIDPSKVHVGIIVNGGSGYDVNQRGTIIVGGFAFIYNVDAVSGGVVSQLSLISDYPNDINIANFNMQPGNSGLTETYGTSPLDPSNSGTGLTVQLLLEDYDSLLPKKGDPLDMLHAFVKDVEGIYLYEYEYNDEILKYEWVPKTLVSPFGTSNPNINDGLTVSDAYMSSMLPQYSKLSVVNRTTNKSIETIQACSTSSFINIIDKTKTPVTPNQSSGQGDLSRYTKVNLCKFRCDGIRTEIASGRKDDPSVVLKRLKEIGVLRYDCYVIWQWVRPTVSLDMTFRYGIIYRSLSNYISTDVNTKLPKNDLRYTKYVHTNTSTTVVWDAPGVNGVMMWVYDPSSTTVEDYVIDVATQDLYVDRKRIDWSDVDFYTGIGGETINVVNPTTKQYDWMVLSNNPANITGYTPGSTEPLYQQPEFELIAKIGDYVTMNDLPKGNWKLVFPRCESFTMRNTSDTGVTYKPLKLQSLRISDSTTIDDIYDENKNVVNAKTMIIHETSEGASLKVYNDNTGDWVTV